MRERNHIMQGTLTAAVATLMLAAAAGATDRYVPGEYSTIQTAVDAASPGDTIHVAAGTYAEAVIINKALTIQGAGCAGTTIDATGQTSDIAVNISSPGGDVMFDGFAIRTKGVPYPDMTFGMNVVSTTPGSTITVTNSAIEGTGDPLNYECGVYVHGTSAAFVFQHNLVTAGGGNPILIEKNPGPTDVSYNTLDAGSYGMSCFYMTYGNTWVTSLQRFSYNTFDLGSGEAYDADHAVHGISITGALWNSYGPGGYSNVEIKGNRFYNGHSFSRGIGLYNDAGIDADGLIQNVVIQDNVIEGITPPPASSLGIRLAGNVTNITVENNLIGQLAKGIIGQEGYYGSHYPGSVTAHANSIVGNGAGVDWASAAEQLHATGNWWGDATGPLDETGTIEAPPCSDPASTKNADGLGNSASENVDYCPWLNAPAIITLTPDNTCYEVGDNVVVDIVLSDATTEIVGGQFWLEYDETKLSYAPGPLNPVGVSPWAVLIYQLHSPPTIFLSVGMLGGGVGDYSGTMARLTFTAAAEICDTAALVHFKNPDGDPPTRLSDRVDTAVYPAKVDLAGITIDSTPPTATQGAIAPCYATAGEADAAALAATTALADNCGPVGVTKAVYTGAGDCDTSIVIRVSDSCGNHTDYTYNTLVDDTPPSATQGTIAACYASAGDADAAALAATTALDDNCGPAGVTKAVYTGAGDCDTSIVIRVSDPCGNHTDYTYNTRVDGTPPVVICPGNISKSADAGLCTAVVTWAAATALDNCDGDVSGTVLYDIDLDDNGSIDDTQAGTTYTFPTGTHKVVARATDTCGNTGTCFFLVTVGNLNELMVNLELRGTTNGPFDRCITFELDPGAVTVKQVVTFVANGGGSRADDVPVQVPITCPGFTGFTCIRARDDLHTLWAAQTAAEGFGIVGTQYAADFTDDRGPDNRLVLGNLNGDQWIDVLDFSIYVVRFGQTFPVNLTCSYTGRHPDFDGSGLVDSSDFSVIQAYFLFADDTGCASPFTGTEPVTRIAVSDLARYDLRDLAPADLNHDGWIDAADIAAFAAGVMPDPGPVDVGEPEIISPGSGIRVSRPQPAADPPAGRQKVMRR